MGGMGTSFNTLHVDPELPHTIVCPAAAQGGASFPATVFNLVNVIMGAGYVSIPYACRQVSLDGGGGGGVLAV